MGRPRNQKMIARVKELRSKGLSFREIARVLKVKNVKSIYRWFEYGL